MLKCEATGRTRHRIHTQLCKSPVLVLQVEIHVTGYEVLDAYGGGLDRDGYHWRDATVGDVTIESGEQG